MTPPDQVSGPPEGGWESLKVDELKAELEARGLPKSGNKAELVARLEDDEVAQADTAPVEEQQADEVVDAEAAAEDEAAEDEAEEPAAPARRGSAETGAPRERKAPARRDQDGAVLVLARAKYVRSAPRKARLVMDHIRGKRVEQAQAILQHAPRAVSTDILKLLNSAIANAESAYELGPDELRVRRAFVDEGPTIKRFRPRALGRATRINKRTSHMTIELTTEGNGR
jgi:large subunit ribosomal protein L22